MQSVYNLYPRVRIQSVLAGKKNKRNWNPSAQGETKAISRLPGQGAPVWAPRGQLGLVPVLEAKARPVSEWFPARLLHKEALVDSSFLFLSLPLTVRCSLLIIMLCRGGNGPGGK